MNDSVDFQFVVENAVSLMESKPRIIDDMIPAWNYIVILVSLLLVVLNKQLYRLRLRVMLSELTQSSDSERMMREKNPVVGFNGFNVFVSYVAMLSLIVQKIVVIYSGNTILYDNFAFYLDICTFIAAVCILQYLFISLYGWLFGMESATAHQVVTSLSTMAILDVVMLFICLIIIFYPIKIILLTSIAIIVIIMVIRIIKTFFEMQILSKMNLFNIFLYFCTLEIIPISVAITMMCRLIATDCVL